jgi:hypothetical protein
LPKRVSDLVDDLDVLGSGGALGHAIGRPHREIMRRGGGSSSEGDERDGDFARMRIGPADHGGGRDRWMLEERVLDRRRIDVMAPAG